MSTTKTVVITGAAGNLGAKLRRHLEGRYSLRLLDRDPGTDTAITRADLSDWNDDWVREFRGADAVVHLAANPGPIEAWPALIGANVDGVVHMFTAAARAKVRRIVFASSNHVMGGYLDDPEPVKIKAETPPRPGTRYVTEGKEQDSVAYGSSKLFGERLGKCYAQLHGLSVVAVRIGWVRSGENRPEDMPPARDDWFRLMWLSNRDFCQLMARAIEADPSIRFAVVNGMSRNTGMRWDIEGARRLLGYEPLDDVNGCE